MFEISNQMVFVKGNRHPLFQLIIIFCLHSTVVMLSKPNLFISMEHSRTEKSPWMKSETKPGPSKKKMEEVHPDRRQNLAKSDKGLWFYQPLESEAACASFLD